jgi:hypothetical protein
LPPIPLFAGSDGGSAYRLSGVNGVPVSPVNPTPVSLLRVSVGCGPIGTVGQGNGGNG